MAGRPSRVQLGPRVDYPALVKQAGRTEGDTTAPVPSTPVRLIGTFAACEEIEVASLETSAGDRVILDRRPHTGILDATTPLPLGTTWRVGPDMPGAVTFEVGDRELAVVARYACTDAGAVVDSVGVAEVIPVGPLSSPSIGR